MATTKQKKALNKIVENGGNVSSAMREVGYSPATATTPSKLTSSKGYQELLEKHGLTDELLITSLVSDIKQKPKNRTKELELGFKLLNRLKDAAPAFQVNVFAQILEKYGLPHARQDKTDAGRSSQNSA